MPVAQINAFEAGELDREGVVDLFIILIRDGYINHLQGYYQRVAQDLIAEGYITEECFQ